ncbi:MAG: glycosyltransferase [Akkermansiaceae bacterium]|nr:glycosyltransferase [Armatimonadota bacterium]
MLCINTGGKGDLHGLRMRRLASRLAIPCAFYDVDKTDRKGSVRKLWNIITERPWRLIYQESTGIAGGFNLIRAARERGVRYIVSSGDPIEGFFRVTKGAMFGKAFGIYERLLMRHSVGFVGWTPYLTGRALELGAPRGVTVEGAADMRIFRPLPETEREQIRREYHLPANHLICGIVGSLLWTQKQNYCYGLELIEAARRLKRTDMSFLIVGDGTGKAILQERVPQSMKDRVIFTGRVPEQEVVRVMNAMHIGFITQSLDGLGLYRLTTKMPEYLACGLPIGISPIPGYFDYIGAAAGWTLPPYHPASATFHDALAAWLETVDRADVESKRVACRRIAEERFDYDKIAARFRSFVDHVLNLPK